MIPRHATTTLHALAAGFPVVAITGPRQSGKTTLAREAFAGLPHVNLEDLDTRELALADPRRFFERHPQGAVLDEVQRAPQLMSYLLGVVDSSPASPPRASGSPCCRPATWSRCCRRITAILASGW